MRPCHWLSFGTLVLVLAGCSSRGGESLFNGEAPPQDIEDEVDSGTERDAASDDEDDASVGDGEPDAAFEEDAGEDAADDPNEPGELPPASIACGDGVCTTPDQYCCRPPGNLGPIPVSPSCKNADEECRFGLGNSGPVGTAGVPQYCSTHADCAGGQCCAIRAMGGPNQQQPQSRYERVTCVLKCEGNDVQVCDPENPQCANGGTCAESDLARGLYVCRT